MHVAQIFSHTTVNGVTTSGRTLVQSLLDRGIKVSVLHRPDAWISKQNFSGDVTFRAYDMGVRWLNYREIARLQNDCVASHVDLLHSHGDVASRITSHIRLFGSLPSVATRHNLAFHPHWRLQNAVIAPSFETAKSLRKHHLVSKRRLHVIPNFLSEDRSLRSDDLPENMLRAKLGLPKGAFVLLSVGEICARKNQSAVPGIIKALQAQGVEAHAVLVGRADGLEDKKVRKNAERDGVTGQVHLLGERHDVADLMQACDAYLSTSHAEQASIALLEALAAGLPAFCTNVGSASEIVLNRHTGHLLDLSDPTEAIDEMARLAKNGSILEQARSACIEHFQRYFAAHRVVSQIEALYGKLVSASRKPQVGSAHFT